MPPPVTGGDAAPVRLGIAIPRRAGPPATGLGWTVDLCARLGLTLVEVSIDALEGVLGAPVPTVSLEPPPADGLALGLLELEEDVLRDSFELAKQTFDSQVRAWRATVSLSPLDGLCRAWQDAGIAVDAVSAPDLVLWSDDEVDYACRVARSTGARVLATSPPPAGPGRLGPFARRRGVALSFTSDTTTSAGDLARILEFDDRIAVSIDLGSWRAGGHESLLSFLDRYEARVAHVRLRDVPADTSAVTFGSGEAPIRVVLRAMRDRGWDFPAVIVVDPTPGDDRWEADVERALAYCRASL